MRVVFVTHNYPRFHGDVAGAFLHTLAVALRQRDVDVRVVAPSDRGGGGRSLIDGVPVSRVRYASPARETLAYGGTITSSSRTPAGLMLLRAMILELRHEARRLLQHERDSVVHAHWWVPAGLAAPVESPLVLTCHGTDVRLLATSSSARLLARPVLRRARVVTTVSRSLADELRQSVGITIADEQVQPMPVTIADRPMSTGQGGVIIVGRLTPQKRVDLAMRAFAIARAQRRDLTLRVVGDGPARAALEALASQLGVGDAVTFCGTVAPPDVPKQFATAACCIMPAVGEGLGLVAAEALIQGVPVIACSDGGGVLDILSPQSGSRVVAPSPDAIAAALLDVVADESTRDSAARAGVAWRARTDPHVVAARCIEWYERAMRAQ